MIDPERMISNMVTKEQGEILDMFDLSMYNDDVVSYYNDALECACRRIVALEIEKRALYMKLGWLSIVNN